MDAQQFLTNVISALSNAPDFGASIANLAQLAARDLADWCGLYLFENEQTIRRVVVAPSAVAEVLFPLDLHATAGPAHVLRTGELHLISNPGAEIVSSLGLQREELVLPAGGWPSIYACMPMVARQRTIGAVVLMSVAPRVQFDETEILLIGNLANAAAVALDNSRLYRQAQEANRLKDEFVAMVSHELRTPLTPILGCVHLLRTAHLSEANFGRALEMIERSARTQVQIVEDLLDVSRIVAGKLHLAMQSTAIAPIVDAALATVKGSAEAKSIRVITQFEDVQAPIDADPHRLQQVVWNLLSNAVKFTPPGGHIQIAVRADETHVQIQVTDSGVGIPADFLPYIFDRFRQAGDGNSEMRSGLGLGLTIVRHLVELHNGAIEAASAGPGKGAVFTIRFPFAARLVAAAGSIESAGSL